jgi:hypothetical protein
MDSSTRPSLERTRRFFAFGDPGFVGGWGLSRPDKSYNMFHWDKMLSNALRKYYIG